MAPGYVSNKKTYYSCGAKRNKNITTKPHDESISCKTSILDDKVWDGLVELIDDPDNLKEQLEKRLEKEMLDQPEQCQTDKIDKDFERWHTKRNELLMLTGKALSA